MKKRSAAPSTDDRTRTFSPLAVTRGLFTKHLRLKKGRRGLEFVLEEKRQQQASSDAVAATVPTAAVNVPPEKLRAFLMYADLRALMDKVEGSRRVLRQLAAIEHGIKHKDPSFLLEVPLAVLRKAASQIDGLATLPIPEGIAELRKHLYSAIRVHEQRAQQELQHQLPSTLTSEEKLEVRDASNSAFDKALAEWNDSLVTIEWEAPAPLDKIADPG